MAGSQQDWSGSESPVGDKSGKTPGPGEQPEQEGSTRRQQEQGVIGGDQSRPQGSNRSSMPGGSSPNQGQALESRSDGQSM